MRYAACLGLMLCSGISTSAEMPKQVVCQMKAEIYTLAAWHRDAGRSPQIAFEGVHGYKGGGITVEFMKKAINNVYFDERFANARGPLFQRQMADLCMTDGQPRFVPLK